jgi:DNA-binding response OmpR family regulator
MILLAVQHLCAHLVLLQSSRWSVACHAALGGLIAGPDLSDAAVPDKTVRVRFDDGAPLDASCATPEAALQDLRQGRASAAVLMPSHDGRRAIDWLIRLRAAALRTPPVVVMLLPDADAEAHLAALRSGADAVLPLEASAALIAAQLDRLRPRTASAAPNWLEGPGGLRLEAATLRAWVGEQPLSLKPGLFRLLWCLVAEPDRVFSLSALRVAIEVEASTQVESIHAYVSRLRKALRPHRIDACIQTVHRFGYRCVPVLGSSTAESGRGSAAQIDA